MADRNVTDNPSNPDKSQPVLADRLMVIDSETTPNSLKEWEISVFLKFINQLTVLPGNLIDAANDYLILYDGSDVLAKRILPSSLFSIAGTWTPTWGGLTVGSGTLTTKYLQVGKLVAFWLTFVFAADSSLSGALTFSLPVTPFSWGVNLPVGVARLKDATGGAAQQGVVQVNTGTNVAQPIVFDASGTYVVAATVTGTVPFTWATSDDFECSGVYLAA